MTRHVVALPEDATVAEAASLMVERAVKRIPIVRDGRVTGIISRRDLLRALARPDAAIRAEVEELLDERVLQLGEVRVAVLGGVAHLSGPPDRGGQRLAEVLVRSVPGTVGVTFDDPG
jgi:CBS domain-containing protein